MMKSPKNLLIFAILGGIVGTGVGFIGAKALSPETSVVAIDATASEMAAVLAAQQDAWNAGDIEGFMAGYQNSDMLRFASGGDVTRGWDETRERYLARYTDRAAMGRLAFDIDTVTVIDASNGLVFGRWTLTREDDAPTGLFTLHMKKFPDGWKVVSDHTSSAD